MRAFVTGSTGLLGNSLVRTLLQAGYEVWALARSKEKARRELGDTTARARQTYLQRTGAKKVATGEQWQVFEGPWKGLGCL